MQEPDLGTGQGNGMNRIDDTAAAIARICAGIEDAFALTGRDLGDGYSLFDGLAAGLTGLSSELAGPEIEAASRTIAEVADRLTGLAEALSSERALLVDVAADAGRASKQLRLILKHIQMISTIARTARIEAASLQSHRETFQNFTGEAFNLATAVQREIEVCARGQAVLAQQVDEALGRQRSFEERYHDRLIALGAGMRQACAAIADSQARANALGGRTSAAARDIAADVGVAITALQTGDSMRQRLEHVRDALIDGRAAGQQSGEDRQPQIVAALQADQLAAADKSFAADIGQIGSRLTQLNGAVSGLISQAGAILGDGAEAADHADAGSLAGLERTLDEGMRLIKACEAARDGVDAALAVIDTSLAEFRAAVATVSQTVIDIVLIGMNAGIRAGHLGAQGASFAVIANELKATADQIAAGANGLTPILDHIEASVGRLREMRSATSASQMLTLEGAIGGATANFVAVNTRLGELGRRLSGEGGDFARCLAAAEQRMTGLADMGRQFPGLAAMLRADLPPRLALDVDADAPAAALLARLSARYTMAAERQVHDAFLRQVGLPVVAAPPTAPADEDDFVLF
jgi:hypothetical protein